MEESWIVENIEYWIEILEYSDKVLYQDDKNKIRTLLAIILDWLENTR